MAYNYTTSKPSSYSTKSASNSSDGASAIFVIIIFVVIVLIIIGISSSRKEARAAEECRQAEEREKRYKEYLKEQERKRAEEKRKEEERKQRELEEKKVAERKRRAEAKVAFEKRMQTVNEELDKAITDVKESYAQLYDFQKIALADLFAGRNFCILPTGAGKTAVMFNWLKYTRKKKILIVTTASKRDSGDFEEEADRWCGAGWKKSLDKFEIISWHGLYKWYIGRNYSENMDDYAFAFDEVHNAGAGVHSQMGKAFLRITHNTSCWTGYTATPGDKWIKFCPFFIATGKVRNQTQFESQYTIKAFGRGYAYISGYRDTESLNETWRSISTTQDADIVFNEMPGEIEDTIVFDKPMGYETIQRTRTDQNGRYLDSVMALCHSLRQACCTKQKLAWIGDFIDGLETNAVIFYNYVAEGDAIEEIVRKKLPKEAKIWRIDGSHHNIPTQDTIGERDIVIAQYTSGSNSLNLQFIYHWVSFSPNYSYTTSIQAKGRIKRIGQRHTMFFYYFRCSGTIEDDIYACLNGKKSFSEDVWAVEHGFKDAELYDETTEDKA